VEVTVEGGNATITISEEDIEELVNALLDSIAEALEEIQAAIEAGLTVNMADIPEPVVILDFTVEGLEDVVEITLPSELFETVGDADLNLEIAMPSGTVAFDPGVLSSISEQSDGEPITLALDNIRHNSPLIAHGQNRYVNNNSQIFSISLFSGEYAENRITSFDGSVAVSVPFGGNNIRNAKVFFLDANGILHERPHVYCAETNTITFTTTHFSLFVVQELLNWINPFLDVREDAEYFDAVRFVNFNGLFAGTGVDRFAPASPMRRGQMAMVLWRMAGEPLPVSMVSPFTDVTPDSFFYTAVLWAAENNIIFGVGGGLFNPDNNVTEWQATTILNRYAEQFGRVPFANPAESRTPATRADIAVLFYEFDSR
jgi:hypothetical protein